jgi:MSHA pilin protein MshA
MNAKIMKHLKDNKGFTLIEIIAVLVILGILSAVAIPKYLSMIDESRDQTAQAAIAEIKSRLASAQAKYMMRHNGEAPTASVLYDYATGPDGYQSAANLADVGKDFTASVTKAKPIVITVTAVGGSPVNVIGTFPAAGDN